MRLRTFKAFAALALASCASPVREPPAPSPEPAPLDDAAAPRPARPPATPPVEDARPAHERARDAAPPPDADAPDRVAGLPEAGALPDAAPASTPPPGLPWHAGRVGLGPVSGCAVGKDFLVRCWGNDHATANGGSRAKAPAGLAAVAVSGHHHSACAVLARPPAPDAAIRCFGGDPGIVRAPAKVVDPVYIASGEYHACALARDGSVGCWRDGNAPAEVAVVPAGLKAKAVCAMGYTCAIAAAGNVLCWGPRAPRPPEGLRAKAIACGGPEGYVGGHACAIDAEDGVVCWGGGGVEAPRGLKASAIAVGNRRACAADLDGKVVCWGEPLAVKPPERAIALFMHMFHAAAITPDRRLVVFGTRYSMHAPIPPADFEIPAGDPPR